MATQLPIKIEDTHRRLDNLIEATVERALALDVLGPEAEKLKEELVRLREQNRKRQVIDKNSQVENT